MSGVLEMALSSCRWHRPVGGFWATPAGWRLHLCICTPMHLQMSWMYCTCVCVSLRAALHQDSLDITNHDLPTQEVPYGLGMALSRLALDLR